MEEHYWKYGPVHMLLMFLRKYTEFSVTKLQLKYTCTFYY